jgi:hypothetical protein
MPSLPRKKRTSNTPRSKSNSESKKVYDKNKHKTLSARYRKQQGLCENCLHYGILTDITPGKRKKKRKSGPHYTVDVWRKSR